MKKIFGFGLLAFGITFAACKECPCAPAQLKFNLIGFSDAEADTFIIRKFAPNGNFVNKLDTFLIDHVGTARFSIR